MLRPKGGGEKEHGAPVVFPPNYEVCEGADSVSATVAAAPSPAPGMDEVLHQC